MKTTLISICFIFAVLSTSSAHAGIFLQLLHNNSKDTVWINAKVPSYWSRLPPYPFAIPSHVSVFDGDFYDDAYYKTCRHKISNVAVPLGGSCNEGSEGHYLSINIGKKHYYRIYDCNWKINVLKKEGSTYKFHQAIEIKRGQGIKYFFATVVWENGDLKIYQKRDKLDWGDQYRKGLNERN